MELGWVSLNNFDCCHVFKMFLWIKQLFHRLAHCKKIRKGKTPTWSTAASQNCSEAAGGSDQAPIGHVHAWGVRQPLLFSQRLVSSWPSRTQGMKCVLTPALGMWPVRWSWGLMVIPWLSTKRRSSKKLGWFLASYPLQVFSYQMANPCPYPRHRLSYLQATSCDKSSIPIKKNKKSGIGTGTWFKWWRALGVTRWACNTAEGVSSISDIQTSS